jgi:hypothetical protein
VGVDPLEFQKKNIIGDTHWRPKSFKKAIIGGLGWRRLGLSKTLFVLLEWGVWVGVNPLEFQKNNHLGHAMEIKIFKKAIIGGWVGNDSV